MSKVMFIVGRLGGGGAERVLITLANEFFKRNYNVEVLALSENSKNYTTYATTHILFEDSHHVSRYNHIAEIRRNIIRFRPKVIIAFEYSISMKAIVAALGMPVRVIISERNDPNQLNVRKKIRIARDILYHFADTLVCQTEDAMRCFPNYVRKKCIVIPNPIIGELPFWKFEDAEESIIAFGRLEKQKNLPLLINAFEIFHYRHPKYRLKIYGDGSEKEALRKLIDDKKLDKVVMLYNFSLNIHNIAVKSRIYVSTSDYEGISNSMNEALAMGMPVICTDCPIGGAKFMIENGKNGRLVPCNNVDSIANAIEELVENDTLLKQLSKEAVKVREKYSIQIITTQWEALI